MEQLPANKGGSQREEGLVEGIVAFVADQQAAVAVQPGEGTFNDPSIVTCQAIPPSMFKEFPIAGGGEQLVRC